MHIHLHIEIRYKNKWEHYACPTINRNYELFNVMAGVRGDGEDIIIEPKGLPEDMSIITQLSWDYWKLDGHFMSWFNEEEIDKLSEWIN